MKNPFEKENYTTLWIGASITGAIAAGVGIWFYLRGKRAAREEAYRHEHAQDYLKLKKKGKKKKHKTDIEDIAEFVTHT